MVYEIDGNIMLLQISRSDIIDITVGDAIHVKGFPNVQYTWTEHDQQLMESNPDADIFLKMEAARSNGNFKATGFVFRERE